MSAGAKDLYSIYPVRARFCNLLEQIQFVLDRLGILDQVNIDTYLLEKAVLDYFEDIDRLKDYEDIPRVNVDKIYSYGIYWILRRHPLSVIDENLDRKFYDINEKVCISIMFPRMLIEKGIPMDALSGEYRNFLDLLYYNLKYRHYTQQSLELMINAFFCGYSIKVGEVKDGSNGEQ